MGGMDRVDSGRERPRVLVQAGDVVAGTNWTQHMRTAPPTAHEQWPDYAGTRLRAMFASDLGHWDVPDACAVLPEAWELVERGHVTADDFKAFTHDNALALWGDEMFANTVIAAR